MLTLLLILHWSIAKTRIIMFGLRQLLVMRISTTMISPCMQLYVERLKANIVEVKQVGKVRSLRDDKQDVAFLGFGVGYGEPETMWTETIDRTAEYVFHYAQKLQKLLEERIKTTKDTTIKSQYELMYARVQRYMND